MILWVSSYGFQFSSYIRQLSECLVIPHFLRYSHLSDWPWVSMGKDWEIFTVYIPFGTAGFSSKGLSTLFNQWILDLHISSGLTTVQGIITFFPPGNKCLPASFLLFLIFFFFTNRYWMAFLFSILPLWTHTTLTISTAHR